MIRRSSGVYHRFSSCSGRLKSPPFFFLYFRCIGAGFPPVRALKNRGAYDTITKKAKLSVSAGPEGQHAERFGIKEIPQRRLIV